MIGALPIKKHAVYVNKAMQDSINKQHQLQFYKSTRVFLKNTHIHVCNKSAKDVFIKINRFV